MALTLRCLKPLLTKERKRAYLMIRVKLLISTFMWKEQALQIVKAEAFSETLLKLGSNCEFLLNYSERASFIECNYSMSWTFIHIALYRLSC
jgi:hypothetical protein